MNLASDIQPASVLFGAAISSPPEGSKAEGDGDGDFDQLKGQFLASLNHELRTPLSGVLGMTDLLIETSLSEEQHEYVGTIRECASQLLEALNTLLDFSALSAGHSHAQHVEFALPALLESVAIDGEIRSGAKGLRFARHWDANLPESVIGDERYLRQVLQHLVRNAVKFTTRGEVGLAARIDTTSGVSRLVASIQDTGIGIPQDKLRLIFQAFRQLDSGLARSYHGLGLGLALSDKLIRLMGGDITVDSTVGKGTNFILSVPLIVPSLTLKSSTTAASSARRARILVVEDNKIAQRVVAHILDKIDCEVLFADDGERGVQMAKLCDVDLILMDLQMPGMDGFTAARAIRALPACAEIPMVALTANYSDEHRATCRQIGMQGFLSKPIQREELFKTIEQLLAASTLSASSPAGVTTAAS